MKVTSFGGVALSQFEIDDDIPLEFGSALVALPGQAGAFDADGAEQQRAPLRMTRSFELVESDYASVDTSLDNLRAAANLGLGWLVIEMRDGEERGTWAKLKRVQAPYKPAFLLYLPVQLTFEAAWPWFELVSDVWYLDAGNGLDDGLDLDPHYTQQVGAGTFTITNDGGDRIRRGLMVIDGPATDPKVENLTTGEYIQYEGSLASGEWLMIDLGAQRVTRVAGDLVVDGWVSVSLGDRQTRLLSLAVGVNNLSFSGGGTLTFHWVRAF